MSQRIHFKLNVRAGKPTLEGTRLTCYDIVSQNAFLGRTEIDGFWNLTEDEIREVTNYCADLQCLEDNPPQFCFGCTLYEPEDDENYREDVHPLDGWTIADEVIACDFRVTSEGVNESNITKDGILPASKAKRKR